MAITDIFKRKQIDSKESNSLFGQTALGNNVVYQSGSKPTVNTQILYVTTASTNNAGRPVDMSLLTRNSTILACIAAKARAISQLPTNVMCQLDDGSCVNAITSEKVGKRDKAKAKQVAAAAAAG